MKNILFESTNFDAETVSSFKDAKAFIKAHSKHFFVGHEAQEEKMTAVYKLCREATGNPVKDEKPAPSKP